MSLAMAASSHQHQHQHQHQQQQPLTFPYTPTKSSPLTSSFTMDNDDHRIQSSPIFSSAPQSPPPNSTPMLLSSPIAASKSNSNSNPFRRPFRPNPIMRSSEDARERRRNQFMQKIRDQRDQKMVESRGGVDELMRISFLSEQKRREEYQRREARLIDMSYPIDEIPEDVMEEQTHPDEAAMIDEMMSMEEQQLEHMISQYQLEDNEMMMDSQPQPSHSNQNNHGATLPTCSKCQSDELFEMNGETVCFNCGWSWRT